MRFFSRGSLLLALVFALGLLAFSVPASAQVGVAISVGFAPPEIPVYEQPICPGDGYLWTPGYWAWDGTDYYWVPGTWILSPEVGFLWTPPWWGWGGAAFIFHEGYWGPHIGFYGGINYGFGYFGNGFVGGRWDNGHFFYNRAVMNVNVTEIHNVYNTHVTVNNVHISYNGGRGGLTARATAEEESAEHERHVGAVAAQTQHVEAARANQQLRASVNHGRPPVAATSKPGEFNGGAPARSAAHYNPPARAANDATRLAVHPNEVAPHTAPAPNTGNANLDKKYQQEQSNLAAKQEQEHQQLQKKQDQEHQQLEKQHASDAQKQQVEQRHQQQTQQLEQKHSQEQQRMVQHQSPPPAAHEGKPR
jgi:Skp family chaperone for outer membrane proteins